MSAKELITEINVKYTFENNFQCYVYVGMQNQIIRNEQQRKQFFFNTL